MCEIGRGMEFRNPFLKRTSLKGASLRSILVRQPASGGLPRNREATPEESARQRQESAIRPPQMITNALTSRIGNSLPGFNSDLRYFSLTRSLSATNPVSCSITRRNNVFALRNSCALLRRASGLINEPGKNQF